MPHPDVAKPELQPAPIDHMVAGPSAESARRQATQRRDGSPGHGSVGESASLEGGEDPELVSAERAQVLYDALGREKWRAFIDGRDHEAALAETKAGLIGRPGEYYDWRRIGQSGASGEQARVAVGPAFRNFIEADAFVASRLTQPIRSTDYFRMHELLMEGGGTSLQGWREEKVTWGLPLDAPQAQLDLLAERGLTVEREPERYLVTVPPPPRPMPTIVDEAFQASERRLREGRSDRERFSSIVELYLNLELLHPFKDGTSRANHLVLDALLAEHGLGSTILDAPFAPTCPFAELEVQVLAGLARAREVAEVAEAQAPGSREALEAERRRQQLDRQVELMLRGRLRAAPPSARARSTAGPGGALPTKAFPLLAIRSARFSPPPAPCPRRRIDLENLLVLP